MSSLSDELSGGASARCGMPKNAPEVDGYLAPAFELDHIFIFCSVGGEEAEALSAFGLTEGPPNSHAGQGTACRRFFFANFYIELLWVSDLVEAKSGITQPTHLWERWHRQTSGACPFGFIFRPKVQHHLSVPFPGWDYRPAYLPSPLSIHVASNAHLLREPILFYLSFAQRSDRYPIGKRPPLDHPAGLREVTRVQFTSPNLPETSSAFAALTESGLSHLRTDSEYLLELGFDRELQGRRTDFRPALPLAFHWIHE
jgi:hypothetical protein